MSNIIEKDKKTAMRNNAFTAAREFAKKCNGILGDNCINVILYGSYARGDFQEYSDVDIMILTKDGFKVTLKMKSDIHSLASSLYFIYYADISPRIREASQYYTRKNTSGYYMNIDKEGIILYEQKAIFAKMIIRKR
ncbi:MAG: nucleotidyltransferase domain-containing protein [Oscillospiraceae bacterium]|nr:nucleotidyltransferase domain-containing protein [Oscillospiraceae bacterium]